MVFEHREGLNEAMMVVDPTLPKQEVLKKMKVDWRLSKTAVSEGQGEHLKVAHVLPKQVQDDECGDV